MQRTLAPSRPFARLRLLAVALALAPAAASAQFGSPQIAALEQQIYATDGQPSDQLGSAIAVSGNTLVAGAPSHDPAGLQSAGGAWVFVHSGSAWTQQAKL